MASGAVAGTVDDATGRITAAARGRGWQVQTYSRSRNGVVLRVLEPDGSWSGLVRVQVHDSGRVSVGRKRSGGAATAVLFIVTVLGYAVSLLAVAAVIFTAANHPGTVGGETFVALGLLVTVLVILPLARMIWLLRPSRVRRNRELNRLLDTLIAEHGEPNPAASTWR